MTLKHNLSDLSGLGGDNDDGTFPAYVPPPEPFDVSASPVKIVSASTTTSQVLYLTEPGNSTAVSINDLFQGGMGDCFLISAIGELALDHPVAIANMIKVNSNGSETVTLYTAANGSLPNFLTTSFKPISINVTNVFPSNSVNSGAGQDVVGSQKEIWPQVLEKAVATLDGGYGAITNGGFPSIAMEELTGHSASMLSPSSVTLANLNAYIAAGDLITMDTAANGNLGYNLVNDHAYMFEGITGSGSGAMIKLGNPWGYDQPSLIPISQLAKAGIDEVDVGKF
jgi:hypothetical protein